MFPNFIVQNSIFFAKSNPIDKNSIHVCNLNQHSIMSTQPLLLSISILSLVMSPNTQNVHTIAFCIVNFQLYITLHEDYFEESRLLFSSHRKGFVWCKKKCQRISKF